MKPYCEWRTTLGDAADSTLEVLDARNGSPTLRIDGVYLHSRYNPEQEAAKLVDSAKLNPDRPVVVLGLGLGYHVAELLARGFEVAIIEPDPKVARAAMSRDIVQGNPPLHVGALDALGDDAELQALAEQKPQWLAHPPTARLHPDYAVDAQQLLTASGLQDKRLNIAVVGPMYGGSLPIAGYLRDAFERLGHNALLVDNDPAWPLYEQATKGVEHPTASARLGEMLAHFANEWTYARVAEFDPEICIVLAQAPVGKAFPLQLAKNGIASAFWFVENWRHMSYWREVAPFYDAFFHIQPGDFERQLDEAGCANHAFVQTGCDPNHHRPVLLGTDERAEYECEISFAGAGYYNRLQVFRGLTDYDFKLWGVAWPDRELAPLVQGGERRFDAEKFMKIVAGTKVNLNLHSSATHEGIDPDADAINPRVFEIAAAGGFQLCDPCANLDRHFTEEELPRYRDLSELRQRIDHYLAHPDEREAAADAARKRALAEHTYDHRAQQMLDFILERHGAGIMKKGVRTQRSIGEVAERLDADSPLRSWLATLPADLPFTQQTIDQSVQTNHASRSYPEKVFAYLREVREFAEKLIQEPR